MASAPPPAPAPPATAFFQAEASLDVPDTDLLSWMFDAPTYDLNKTLYISANDPTRTLTGTQCHDHIRRLAKGFRDAGLQPGDVVLLHAFNDINYPLVALGAIAAGGIWTGTNPAYTCDELAHHLRSADARFVVAEPELLPAVRAAGDACGIPAANYWVFDVLPTHAVPAGYRSWRALLAGGECDWVRLDTAGPVTTAMRLFSSGTTGLPKAANISHQNLIAQNMAVTEFRPRDYEPTFCLPLPMFHVAAVPIGLVSVLRLGRRALVLRRFDLRLYVATLGAFGVTDIGAVPPIVRALVLSPLAQNPSAFATIRNAVCGAAPLAPGLQRRLQKLLPPGAQVSQVWGMTETTATSTRMWPGQVDDTGSVGYLIPGLEAKLLDDDGNEIRAFNRPGEMCIRGKTVFLGYHNNPEANRLSFDSDGFYKTGDIMYCDGASRLWYIIDRKKELIKVRGFQVVPPELEAVLISHPAIIDAAVIGVRRKNSDGEEEELPRAYVVRRPGTEVTEKEVFEYARLRLASYKRLDGGVVFAEEIPRNASGKILKATLRGWAAKEGVASTAYVGAKL